VQKIEMLSVLSIAGDGTARLVDVMIAVVVAIAAIIVTAIVATCIVVYKVFMRKRMFH